MKFVDDDDDDNDVRPARASLL